MKALHNTKVISSRLSNKIFINACDEAKTQEEAQSIYDFMKLNNLEYWKTYRHLYFYGSNEKPQSIFEILAKI